MQAMAATPIRVARGRCLNGRHEAAGCAVCLDACPAAAIILDGPRVELRPQRCTGCGACLPACPTEVFSCSDWDERRVLAGLLADTRTPMAIACARRSDEECREAGAMRVSVCLAALSPGLLFEAGLAGRVALQLDACADCPITSALHRIVAAADQSDRWLQAAGRAPLERVSARVTPPAPKARRRWRFALRASREQAVAEERRVDRRRFLSALVQSGASAYMEMIGILGGTPDGEGAAAESGDRAGRDLLPRWRAHLRAAHASVEDDPGRIPAPWPAIAVSGACTACGACDRVCPTSALSALATQGTYALRFTPGTCVDCGLCVSACAAGAITLTQSPAARPYEPAPVFEAAAMRCARCRAPIVDPERDLCRVCAAAEPAGDVVESARAAFRERPSRRR
jgi:ferredoxin